MALVPLKIPAGFYRNGTDYDASGRWRDGSLVRWRDGSLRPIGGWQERKVNFSTNPIRGMHSWEANNGTAWLAGGSHTELNVMTGSNTVTDVAPSNLATGRADAEIVTGYGYGFYGTSYYGQPRPDYGNYSEATTWSIDNWGEYLVACNTDDGRILEWRLNAAVDAAAILNAPLGNSSLVVTEERFIFALGSGGNPRKIAWCDRENNTIWTAAANNEAGDIELQTSGQIMLAIRTKGQTLIMTDVDAHTARYQGPPYVYGFERVGTSCGAISRTCAADVDAGVFWMGQRGFYMFNGNSVQEVPCEVHDYVFGDMNPAQQSKIWALNNGQFGEIWWFYPSANSVEIDRYVAFDYKEQHWLIGDLKRTSGVQRGVFKYPFMARSGAKATTTTFAITVANVGGSNYFHVDGTSHPILSLLTGNTYIFDVSDSTNNGHPLRFKNSDDSSYSTGVVVVGTQGQAGATVTLTVASNAPTALKYYCTVHGNNMGNNIAVASDDVDLIEHEVGLNVDSASIFAETGPISAGVGDKVLSVTKVISDELTQGDVDLTFKTRFYPNDVERSYGPFNPSNPTSVRFSGRQFRMRIEGDKLAAWRVGTMRVEVKPMGTR